MSSTTEGYFFLDSPPKGNRLMRLLFDVEGKWRYREPRQYLPAIFLMTLVYLIVELSFNARLLDVVGGKATMDEIDSIELYGRAISGVALGLALMGFVLPFFERRGMEGSPAQLGACALTMALSIGIMYQAQEFIVDHIVDSSNEEERYAAMRLRLLTDAVHDDRVVIADIDLSPEVLLRPEGKSFMALLPVMAFSIEDLKERTDDVMQQVVRNAVISEVGDSVTFYNEVYVPMVENLYEVYVGYAKASNAYGEAIASIPDQQEQAWRDYESSLAERGYNPNTVPHIMWNRVRSEVRAKGVDVPHNWQLTDWRSFYAAVEQKVRSRAELYYKQAVGRISGPDYDLRPGTNFRDFALVPRMQESWLEELDLVGSGVRILPDYSYEQFRDLVWEKIIAKQVQEKMEMLRADTAQFRDGGRYEEEGRVAMKALAVPPIALFISLIGGFVHLFKVSNYGLRIIWPSFRLRFPLLAAGFLVLVWLPFGQENPITQSVLYDSFKANTDERLGEIGSAALTWIIQAQPYAYPVNDTVRRYPLLGFSFGYEDK